MTDWRGVLTLLAVGGGLSVIAYVIAGSYWWIPILVLCIAYNIAKW